MVPPERPASLTGWLSDFRRDSIAVEFFAIQTDLLAVVRDDGIIRRINPAWMTLLGFSEAELIERPFAEIIAHNGTQLSIEQLRQMYTYGGKVLLRLMSKSGDRVDCGLISAHIRGGETYVILRPLGDASEICDNCGRIVEAQAQSIAAQRRMRLVLDRMPCGAAVLDDSAHIRYINQSMLRILKFEPGELDGLNLFDLMAHPDETKARVDLFRLALSRPGSLVDYDVVLRMRDKEQQWHRFVVSVLNLLGDALVRNLLVYFLPID